MLFISQPYVKVTPNSLLWRDFQRNSWILNTGNIKYVRRILLDKMQSTVLTLNVWPYFLSACLMCQLTQTNLCHSQQTKNNRYLHTEWNTTYFLFLFMSPSFWSKFLRNFLCFPVICSVTNHNTMCTPQRANHTRGWVTFAQLFTSYHPQRQSLFSFLFVCLWRGNPPPLSC